MTKTIIADGILHEIPDDMKSALKANPIGKRTENGKVYKFNERNIEKQF